MMKFKSLQILFFLTLLLSLTSCQKRQITVGESHFFTYDDHGVQVEAKEAVFNVRQTIILQMFEIKGFKRDKDGFCHPGMDLFVRNSKDSVVFESKNYIGKDVIMELKNNAIPFLFSVWQATPIIPPGKYYFDILLYDRISDNKLQIKQAFTIR